MKGLILILGILLSTHLIANEELNQAITGFNKLAQTGTDPLMPCDGGKLPPSKVIYEQGEDASKLHEKVDLGLGHSFEEREYEGDKLTVLTKEEAIKLFKAFSEVDYMQFDYLHGGCEIRAHEYALIAKANGIEMGKAMIMYGDKIDVGGLYPKEWAGTNKDKAPVPDGFIGWRYHVAPYVLVKNGDKIEPLVFDVGIATKPKSLTEWSSSLKNSTEKETRTFVKERDYLHPDDEKPREAGKSYISTEINKKKLIREMGYYDFEYFDSKGLLSY